MAPPSRKRRAPVEEEGDDDEGSQNYEEEVPRNTQRRRRRTQQADNSDEEREAPTQNGDDGETTAEALSRKLVRYALACEFSRQSIRREGIREKVIGLHGRGHSFKKIFDAAQKELQEKFGMQMMELPTKEKVTLKERRDAAQKNTQTSSATTNSYTLVSILPAAYRVPTIIPPSNVPTQWLEASYIGLYTTIISLIYLSGGTLGEAKLERYLKRMNADHNMPLDTTPKVLTKMTKDGYIVKSREVIGTEEITEWRVGPRGKVEVGPKGVKGLVLHVYGERAPDDLAKRIHSSLGLEPIRNGRDENGAAEEVQANGNDASGSAPRRRRHPREEEDED